MKRPAGQLVRSSGELHAWVITLQAQAVDAAERVSALYEREILCDYPGQRQGSARHGPYLSNSCDWKLSYGQKRFAASVCFRWSVVGATDLELVITEQQRKDARLRGVSLPQISGLAAVAACSVWCARALQALESAANEFVGLHGPQLQEEFGQQLVCTYKYQTETQHRDPKQWVVPSDGRRSHCNVTFEIGFVRL